MVPLSVRDAHGRSESAGPHSQEKWGPFSFLADWFLLTVLRYERNARSPKDAHRDSIPRSPRSGRELPVFGRVFSATCAGGGAGASINRTPTGSGVTGAGGGGG